MKFQIVDRALHVTSETPAEAGEMLAHYKLDLQESLAGVISGQLHHVCKPGRDNGQWFEVSHSLGAEWIKPYTDRLTHWTGFVGTIPEIEAPKYPRGYCLNLGHTHIVTRATMASSGFTFHGFIHSQDWNGKTAAQRFGPYFAECISAAVGDTKHEPEFLHVGNSDMLKPNPNYLKRHYPHPAATSAAILELLLQWWIATHATAGQRDILARCIKNHQTVCKRDSLGSFLLRSYDAGYRVDWGGALITLEQFKGA